MLRYFRPQSRRLGLEGLVESSQILWLGRAGPLEGQAPASSSNGSESTWQYIDVALPLLDAGLLAVDTECPSLAVLTSDRLDICSVTISFQTDRRACRKKGSEIRSATLSIVFCNTAS